MTQFEKRIKLEKDYYKALKNDELKKAEKIMRKIITMDAERLNRI